MDYNFDQQMSLSKSECWYSNNCLRFFKVCCSIAHIPSPNLTPNSSTNGTFTGSGILTNWGRCQKTFYGRKLRLFIISQSICPWQAFPAQSNVQSQPERSDFQVLHSRIGSWPHPQTLDQAGEALQRQTLQLIMKSRNLRP